MAESRNLNSGFLHTRFVDLDFTVAKIITILPTGYEPNYYTLPTAKIEENLPVCQEHLTVPVLYRSRTFVTGAGRL